MMTIASYKNNLRIVNINTTDKNNYNSISYIVY